jgi:hypothetical protein
MALGVGESKPTGELSAGGVRALKIAIVVMGIMIVLGLLAVIGRIFYLAGKPQRPLAASGTSASTASGAVVLAPRVRAEIPAGAAVKTMALAGDRLAVHFDAPAGGGILVIELASGEVVSRVDLVPAPPRN